MEDNKTMESSAEYNDIPVYYCKHCLSLRIRGVGFNVQELNYCDKCGSTEIETSHIEEWEKLYQDRYKHKYLDTY